MNPDSSPPSKTEDSMRILVRAVQDLSSARDLKRVMEIVREAARVLAGADGATFVIRERDICYYADENAIGPLWKGQRFPMATCVSGWAMINKQTAVIEDIRLDPRIPQEAYSTTFVRSLIMVPIRVENPVGAIGVYWKYTHKATPEQIEVVEALANTTSVAIENIQLYQKLEKKIKNRTAQLEAAHYELAAFSYSISNDLQAPLRSIEGYTQILADVGSDQLDPQKAHCFQNIASQTRHMSQLIEDLRELAEYSHVPLDFQSGDLAHAARGIGSLLKEKDPSRSVEFKIPEEVLIHGDARLLGVAVEQLFRNAWKYTAKVPHAIIEFGAAVLPHGNTVYFVKDNGAGFDMKHAEEMFVPFQRLHRENEFTGTGIGLATVQRIIHRHGGRIWVHSEPGQGAAFYFTLGAE